MNIFFNTISLSIDNGFNVKESFKNVLMYEKNKKSFSKNLNEYKKLLSKSSVFVINEREIYGEYCLSFTFYLKDKKIYYFLSEVKALKHNEALRHLGEVAQYLSTSTHLIEKYNENDLYYGTYMINDLLEIKKGISFTSKQELKDKLSNLDYSNFEATYHFFKKTIDFIV